MQSRPAPRRRSLLQAATACALAGPLAARAQAVTNDTAKLLRERIAQEGVGLVAAQADSTTTRFSAAGGMRAGSETAPDADTRFEWGSITKTFTALLLADMVVRGELALRDAVQDALPSGTQLLDSTGEPIRWFDLATQRSGLPRLPSNQTDVQTADPYANYGEQALLSFLADWRPSVQRGSRFEYSNLGFGLLGHALGRRHGGGFEAALTQRVLQPLGLGGVQLQTPGRVVPNTAQGHDAQRKPVPAWHFQALAGAGALVGSATELARYAMAALGHIDTALAPAFKLALTRQADGAGPNHPIGLAWMLGTLNGRPLANHDGGTYGFSSSLFLDLERRRASLVLANASAGVTDLALHLLDSSVPLRNIAAERQARQAAQEQNAVPQAAEALASLAGVYALNSQFKLNVRARDGKLFAQATGQGEFELFASQARRFFARVTPLELVFDGDSGSPAALTLLQAGQRLRFVRE